MIGIGFGILFSQFKSLGIQSQGITVITTQCVYADLFALFIFPAPVIDFFYAFDTPGKRIDIIYGIGCGTTSTDCERN
jgi:hypothetical protein